MARSCCRDRILDRDHRGRRFLPRRRLADGAPLVLAPRSCGKEGDEIGRHVTSRACLGLRARDRTPAWHAGRGGGGGLTDQGLGARGRPQGHRDVESHRRLPRRADQGAKWDTRPLNPPLTSSDRIILVRKMFSHAAEFAICRAPRHQQLAGLDERPTRRKALWRRISKGCRPSARC